MSKDSVTTEFIPQYEGDDMASYIMEKGFKLYMEPGEQIKSIVNIRDTAIIVTNYWVWRARPEYQIGFCLEKLCAL